MLEIEKRTAAGAKLQKNAQQEWEMTNRIDGGGGGESVGGLEGAGKARRGKRLFGVAALLAAVSALLVAGYCAAPRQRQAGTTAAMGSRAAGAADPDSDRERRQGTASDAAADEELAESGSGPSQPEQAAPPASVPTELRTGSLSSPSEVAAAVAAAMGGETLIVTDSGPVRSEEERRARGEVILQAIGAHPGLCALRILDLRYTRVTAEGIDALSSPCLELATLSLHGTGFDDAAAAALARWPKVGALKNFVAETNYWLTPAGIAILAEALAPGLESLWLGQNLVGVRGAVVLAGAEWPHLRALVLRNNPTLQDSPIGPEGARALASAHLPALETLDLQGNAIGDQGLEALIDSGLAGRLKTLGLKHNHISREAAAALGARAPRTEATLEPAAAGAWSAARAGRLKEDGVLPASLTVSSNADAGALSGVTEIRGDLTLTGRVGELRASSGLLSVSGDLTIRSTETLASLEGLSALEQVGGDLLIERNLGLRSTAGLKSLRSVGGSLLVPHLKAGNPGLEVIAFPALESVGGGIVASREPGYLFPPVKGARPVQVREIAPFERLRSVGDRHGLVEDEPELFPALPAAP